MEAHYDHLQEQKVTVTTDKKTMITIEGALIKAHSDS